MTGLELVPILFLGLIAGIVGLYVTRQPSQEKRPIENPRPAIGGAISKSSHG
jgi:H+/Cl- antiporter ClcA